MVQQKVYNAGLYYRLSKEDERLGESVSIENQKLLLERFAQEKGWNITGEYVDDGYTGVNFDRPGFKKMVEDIKDEKINVAIVKDLSRLGRDHIQIGQFTDYLCPSFGCRFIAINNNVDTIDRDGNDMMPFINLFNEFYSKDTSKKIRSAKRTAAINGRYQAMCPPYGYIKSPDDKHQLIIDEDVVENIRRIFRLRCEGFSQRKIATTFNEDGIPAPNDYFYEKGIITYPPKGRHMWTDISIHKILTSEVYIGHLTQGMTGSISYKNRKVIKKDKSEWIKVENTHEAAIDISVWNTVKELTAKNYKHRSCKNGDTDLFSGLLKCMDCGFAMRVSTQKYKRNDKTNIAYVCNTYGTIGKSACSSHRINKKELVMIVIASIKKHAKDAVLNEKKVLESFQKKRSKITADQQENDRRELKKTEQKIAELETTMVSLYEDRVSGKVPVNICANFLQKYDTERIEKEARADQLRSKLSAQEKTTENISDWVKMIKQYASIEELDRRMLLELIDKIEIGDKQQDSEGNKVQPITIHYKLVGAI